LLAQYLTHHIANAHDLGVGDLINNIGSLGIGVVYRQFWRQFDLLGKSCRPPAVQLLAQLPRQFPESHSYSWTRLIFLYYGLVRSTNYILIRVMRPGNLLILRSFEAHRVAWRKLRWRAKALG
jgi:hypothetical protein